MAIEDHYRYMRRRIARCGCVDSLYVIWAYTQLLQVRDFAFPGDIEKHADFVADHRTRFLVHEWELESIATEVILHAGSGTKSMRDWATLAAIVNRLRRLENEVYGDNEHADVLIEVNRILHRQTPWQQLRPRTRLLQRYHLIFSDAEIDAICRKVVGLSVDGLYVQGILAYTHFFTAPALDAVTMTGPEQRAFLTFCARPIGELRSLVAAVHKLDDSYAYQVGPLRQSPLVQVSNESRSLVLCPLPTLLFWRLTSGLYYDLIKGDRDFGNALGSSFQRYIGSVISRAITSRGLRFLGEVSYGKRRHPKATTDWLLLENDAAVAFIECKTKRITVPAKTALHDLATLKDDLSKLAEAVVQVYERVRDYQAGQFPNLPYVPARKCYPVVVTLEDWYLMGERMTTILNQEISARLQASGLDPDVLERNPYCILSADEFEDAIPVIDTVGLATCFDTKLADPERRRWLFANYLRDSFPDAWRNRRPVFDETATEFLERISAGAANAAT